MSSFWHVAFGILLIIIWIVAGGFVTRASTFLRDKKGKDEKLNRAYTYTFWAAVVTWVLVGLFVLLIILAVFGVLAIFGSGAGEAAEAGEAGEAAETAELSRGERAKNAIKSPRLREEVSKHSSLSTILFLLFALVLVGTTGVLSALAAGDIASSPKYDPSINKLRTAYTDCIVAASLCLGAGGLLIIGIVVYIIIDIRRKGPEKKEEKKLLLVHDEEAERLRRAEATAVEERARREVEERDRLRAAAEDIEIRKLYQKAGVNPNSPVPVSTRTTTENRVESALDKTAGLRSAATSTAASELGLDRSASGSEVALAAALKAYERK